MLQTALHNLRKLLPVHGMRLVVANLTEGLIRILDDRRTLVRMDRRHPFNHCRNPFRIVQDDLPCLFLPEIGKLRKHLLRGTEIKRRLIVRICKTLAGHNNPPVHLVLRIQEMHVAGGRHRLLVLLPECNDFFIDGNQILV